LSEGFENTKIIAKTWAKTKMFAKTFAKTKFFLQKLSRNEILRKASEFSHIFAFREKEIRGFRFNPELTQLQLACSAFREIICKSFRESKNFVKIFVCAKVFANIFVFSKPSAKN
jgi:hypothetical protein